MYYIISRKLSRLLIQLVWVSNPKDWEELLHRIYHHHEDTTSVKHLLSKQRLLHGEIIGWSWNMYRNWRSRWTNRIGWKEISHWRSYTRRWDWENSWTNWFCYSRWSFQTNIHFLHIFSHVFSRLLASSSISPFRSSPL